MDYAIAPQAYLARARERLLSERNEELFYAAFELRCAVEKRYADYLDALEYYKGQKTKTWHLSDASRKIERLWKHPKIAKLTYIFDYNEFPTYYTPIPSRVTRAAEKLGSLLHSQPRVRAATDGWWDSTRSQLIELYRGAWAACRGEHMAPPLWDSVTGIAHPSTMYASPATADLLIRILRSKGGARFILRVEYLDAIPADWNCDM